MMDFRDAGYGYDVFGFNPEWLDSFVKLLMPVYKYYFRVSSHGIENIPLDGPGILASNHSGIIPVDGLMIGVDVYVQTDHVRAPRAIMDHFVGGLPFIGTVFTRVGGIGGSRGNFRRSLEDGDLLLVFPEGEPGISKPFSKRYQLQKWRVGHVELAIRHQVPVIPTAVIGAEEQYPLLAKLPIKAFGAPHLPIPLVPFPLPVHYHLYYGEPIVFDGQYKPEDANDPEVLVKAAETVKSAVAALIKRGLDERKGVFA